MVGSRNRLSINRIATGQILTAGQSAERRMNGQTNDDQERQHHKEAERVSRLNLSILDACARYGLQIPLRGHTSGGPGLPVASLKPRDESGKGSRIKEIVLTK